MKNDHYNQKPEPIFALHGWGLNSKVFDSLAIEQATGRKVMSVDLPGHGSRYNEKLGANYEKIAQDLLEIAPPRAVWMGWSLGGMLALAAAQKAPSRVSALVVISASFSFIAGGDFHPGLPKENLTTMQNNLSTNYKKTVKDFLSSISTPSKNGRAALRVMRSALKENGQANPEALADGLKLLQTINLIDKVQQIETPTIIIGGEKDWLVKPQALKELANLLNCSKLVLLKNCGHVPFLEQKDIFNEHLKDFLSMY